MKRGSDDAQTPHLATSRSGTEPPPAAIALAFFRGNSGERGHQLVHFLAATVGTFDGHGVNLRNMKALCELFVTILAVKDILRHDHSLRPKF
jgi:hypothetical protein